MYLLRVFACAFPISLVGCMAIQAAAKCIETPFWWALIVQVFWGFASGAYFGPHFAGKK